MKKTTLCITTFLFISITWFFTASQLSAGLDQGTISSGLKEALSMSTERAIAAVGRTDGFYGNQLIKILMPEKLRMVTDALSKAGMKKQVDAFILSMNRAAEKAAPKAASIFIDAIKGMNMGDAQKILNGGDTAATDFFKEKTAKNIYDAFKPIITASLGQAGTTQQFNNIMNKAKALPLMGNVSFNLDDYVTKKATGGLFLMLGQQEKNIRTNPAARSTELLKTVFGKH
jgi:hypothetical protein